VYRNRSRPTGGPVLIHLHGGAFRIDKKSREPQPLLYRFACQGLHQRELPPSDAVPGSAGRPEEGDRLVRERGPEYGAEPNIFFVACSSAGGHLASMAVLTANDPLLQPGFEEAETSVTAVVLLYGYYGSARSVGRRASD
jgi:acetyl esterase/lipase